MMMAGTSRLESLSDYIAKLDYSREHPSQLSICKGEKLKISKFVHGEDWCQATNSHGEIGLVPTSHIAKVNNLEEFSWFHGSITQEEAELSLSSGIDGSFLVREIKSKPGQYSISLHYDGRVFHYRIHTNPQTLHYFVTPEHKFENLPELVVHHSKNPEGLTTVLRYPAPNPRKSPISHKVDEWKVNCSDIDMGQKLGGGRYREVCKAVIKKRGISVADKTFKEDTMGASFSSSFQSHPSSQEQQLETRLNDKTVSTSHQPVEPATITKCSTNKQRPQQRNATGTHNFVHEKGSTPHQPVRPGTNIRYPIAASNASSSSSPQVPPELQQRNATGPHNFVHEKGSAPQQPGKIVINALNEHAASSQTDTGLPPPSEERSLSLSGQVVAQCSDTQKPHLTYPRLWLEDENRPMTRIRKRSNTTSSNQSSELASKRSRTKLQATTKKKPGLIQRGFDSLTGLLWKNKEKTGEEQSSPTPVVMDEEDEGIRSPSPLALPCPSLISLPPVSIPSPDQLTPREMVNFLLREIASIMAIVVEGKDGVLQMLVDLIALGEALADRGHGTSIQFTISMSKFRGSLNELKDYANATWHENVNAIIEVLNSYKAWLEAISRNLVDNDDPEKNHRVCERVIKAGCVITIIAVIFNYLGLPRSGKTSLRRRITREIENIRAVRQRGEIEQPSTGIMEDGGQVLIKPSSLEMGTIRSKVWSVLKDLEDEANMLNQFFHQIQSKLLADKPTPSVTAYETSAIELVPITSDSPMESVPTQTSILKKPAQSKPTTPTGEETTATPEVMDDTNEMLSIIREAMESDRSEEIKYLLEDTILLVNNDTGGHAEFLDLQAALIQGPSFNLFFSRLVDDLDSLFKIYYTNEEGVSTDKEDSTMTVEEVMYQALASIACFSGAFAADDTSSPSEKAKKSQSKVMFVGTHRDMVSEEEFKAKDEHLQKKIESTEFYKKGIIEYASENQLMLAVDNMNGDQAEIEGVQSILEKVIEESFVRISIPAAWLVLSLYLRKKKLRTISLTECEKLAGKLGINPEELQDALWFLHHRVGVLLYYPEVEAMRDTVICQMQVVFDSASNLIRNTFTFDKVGQYVSKEFREKGQFSLKDVKKAVSGHTDSLIPLEKLVMLLQHLNILTPIIPSTPSSSEESHGTPEPTYFMPCILQSARASELKIETSAEDPAPLMLRYECGYVPVGVFPSMITNLVSQQLDGWKLIKKRIYKNRVRFYVGGDYDTVTLISHPRFLEIAITRTKGFVTPTALLCSHVRGVIQSTLDTVTSCMNNHFSMGYKFGFECPAHPGRDHLCVLAKESAKRMECLQNPEDITTFPLEPRHKLWFMSDRDAVPDVTHSSNTCTIVESHTELVPSLKTLRLIKWRDEFGCQQTFRLVDRVSAKWKDFGIQLDMSLDRLEALKQQHLGDAKDCWNKVMSHWLAGGGGRDYPASWEGLHALLNDLELSKVAWEMERAVAGHSPF